MQYIIDILKKIIGNGKQVLKGTVKQHGKTILQNWEFSWDDTFDSQRVWMCCFLKAVRKQDSQKTKRKTF